MLAGAVKLCPPWCSQQGVRASQNFSRAPGTGDREAPRLVSSSQQRRAEGNGMEQLINIAPIVSF